MVIFPITRSVRVEKNKKKKKIFFKRTFFLAVFLFPVINRGKKVSGFFFRKGRGKMLKKVIKKEKKIFLLSGGFFTFLGR